MKISTFFICILLFSLPSVYGQTKVVYGKILDEYLETVPFARVQSSDSTILTKTDLQGIFKIEIPFKENKLIISDVGYEWATILLPKNCENLEIILLLSATYDFMSFRKIDRQRKRQFNKLPNLHQKAYERNIFLNIEPCYIQEFSPIRPKLDRKQKK